MLRSRSLAGFIQDVIEWAESGQSTLQERDAQHTGNEYPQRIDLISERRPRRQNRPDDAIVKFSFGIHDIFLFVQGWETSA
jgi:hypothetical protein